MILAVLLVLLIIGALGVVYYVNSYLEENKTRILSELEFLDNGTVEFDSVTVSIFKNFPQGTIELNNFLLYDSLYHEHQRPILKAKQVEAALSLKEWRSKEFVIETIYIKDGVFNFHRDELGYNNLTSILKPPKDRKGGKKPPVNFKADQLNFDISDLQINIVDSIKSKVIVGFANKLLVDLDQRGSTKSAKISMDIDMDELTFKKEKGSFLDSSNVQGDFDLILKDSMLLIPTFDLIVDSEEYIFNAEINTKLTTPSSLVFEKENTNFAAAKRVLPADIQEKLIPYQIDAPFYSKTTIHSTFKPGESPIVTVDFDMEKMDLVVHDHLFKKTTLKGRFVNRLYDDERAITEGKKNIRIEIFDLLTYHDVFKLKSDKVLITATPKDKGLIKTNLRITGPASGISSWLGNDKFFFDKGSFVLNVAVDGPLNNKNLIILRNSATLDLKDIAARYAPSNTTFLLEEIGLEKKAGDAKFSIKSSLYGDGRNYFIDGSLKNIEPLLVDVETGNTSSDVTFKANKLAWKDFIDIFGTGGDPSAVKSESDELKKKSMKETIRGVYNSFLPSIKIDIGELNYYDIIDLYNFKTWVHFEGENKIVIEKTTFNFNNDAIVLSGEIDISNPRFTPFEVELKTNSINLKKLLPPMKYFNIELLKNLESLPEDLSLNVQLKGIVNDTIGLIPSSASGVISFETKKNKAIKGNIVFEPIDKSVAAMRSNRDVNMKTTITLSGDAYLFNDFFKSEEFFFDKGYFDAKVNYSGDVTSIEQLIAGSDATLRVQNSDLYYKSANVTFPFKNVEIDLSQDNADFKLFLRSETYDQELRFEGKVDNLSEILIGNTGKKFGIRTSVFSPDLLWKNIYALFPSKDSTPGSNKAKDINTLKATVKGLLNKFNPAINVHVGIFNYSKDLQVKNLRTGIRLEGDNTLILEKTSFDFYDGQVQLDGTFKIDDPKETPFDVELHTKDIDIARLLKSLDYLSIESLRNTKKLIGRVSLNLDLKGAINEAGNGLVKEKSLGTLDFDVRQLEIEGLAIIDSIANKVIFKKRYKDIMFAPLTAQIIIRGEHLEIPLMEVQSNALNLFVEGDVKPDDLTNVWITIPMENLEKKDLTVIPEKRGYAMVRDKVFLEATTLQGQLKMKFHFSKRKFYERRGTLHLFKEDKQRNREIRKQWKKKEREAQGKKLFGIFGN